MTFVLVPLNYVIWRWKTYEMRVARHKRTWGILRALLCNPAANDRVWEERLEWSFSWRHTRLPASCEESKIYETEGHRNTSICGAADDHSIMEFIWEPAEERPAV